MRRACGILICDPVANFGLLQAITCLRAFGEVKQHPHLRVTMYLYKVSTPIVQVRDEIWDGSEARNSRIN
jgi:hypothetical protein